MLVSQFAPPLFFLEGALGGVTCCAYWQPTKIPGDQLAREITFALAGRHPSAETL